jgi:hypothetical protein
MRRGGYGNTWSSRRRRNSRNRHPCSSWPDCLLADLRTHDPLCSRDHRPGLAQACMIEPVSPPRYITPGQGSLAYGNQANAFSYRSSNGRSGHGVLSSANLELTDTPEAGLRRGHRRTFVLPLEDSRICRSSDARVDSTSAAEVGFRRYPRRDLVGSSPRSRLSRRCMQLRRRKCPNRTTHTRRRKCRLLRNTHRGSPCR